MPVGFFPASTLSTKKAPPSLVAKCGACGLFKGCQSPKMRPSGDGQRRILIVGEAPGEEEDKRGIQFVGPAGQLLEEALTSAGIKMRRDCHITNALICRPPGNNISNSEMIDWCRPNLVKTLDEVQPEIIIPLGGTAVQSVLGHLYKEDDIGGIGRWAGWQIPCQKLNVWICPTFHPSFILRSEKNPVPGKMFRHHLREAAGLSGRPWDTVPDYKSKVERILDTQEAAKAVLSFLECKMVAFDYETTTLKPEYEGASIVCCSVSNGKRTIAFPWLGPVIDAMQQLLRSPVAKIASNLKFEERWTRWFYGHGVTNWKWDTMVAAHCLDNRPNITSIKFQSFIWLGAEAYDEHVKKFLRAKGAKVNTIKEDVDLDQLLIYNGLDSLVEYKVARLQMKTIGI